MPVGSETYSAQGQNQLRLAAAERMVQNLGMEYESLGGFEDSNGCGVSFHQYSALAKLEQCYQMRSDP